MRTGLVKGTEIKKNRDGQSDVLLLQVQMADSEDIQTVQLLTQAGEDTNPVNGSLVAILPMGEAWKIGVAVNDGITPTMARGEKKVYSSVGGTIKAFINWLVGGILELNGNADFAVRFTALETAFNQLKTELNTFMAVYNLHTHPTAPVGPVSGPSAPGIAAAADISGAKVDTVKLP